jgi:hypothetical protein
LNKCLADDHDQDQDLVQGVLEVVHQIKEVIFQKQAVRYAVKMILEMNHHYENLGGVRRKANHLINQTIYMEIHTHLVLV